MTINEILFSKMDEKGIKQTDIANKLNIRTSVIGNWKTRGTNPPAEYILPICEILDISVYDLLGTEPDSNIEKIYNMLNKQDREIVDNIFSRYETQEQKSSTFKIG